MMWSDMRSLARVRLSDPLSKIWSDGELLSYANRSLSDLTRDSEATIKHVQIQLVAGQRTYDLPPDLWELRGVKINGLKTFGLTSYLLEELDATYLTATGQPKFYYLDDPQTLAFYPIPTWTSSYTQFVPDDYGEIAYITDGDTYYAIPDDYGVLVEVIDSNMANYYSVVPEFGVSISWDSAAFVALISYVYEFAQIQEDDDEFDLPSCYQDAILFRILAQAFIREGQGQDKESAQFFTLRFEELQTEWFGRSREFSRGQDQFISQAPVNLGSDLDWRQRTWP